MNPLLAYLARLLHQQGGQPAGAPAPQPQTQPQTLGPQLPSQDWQEQNGAAPVPGPAGGYPFAPNNPDVYGQPGEQRDLNYDLINQYLRRMAGR